MSKDKVTEKGAVSIDEDALEQAAGGITLSGVKKPPTELKIKLQDALISSVKQP